MALKPGEELAATLFADVHYFYGPPTAKPPHHRFDKGSYVYLFENGSQRKARIEIANNAGTSDQDAFDGYLDGAHVQYSYKHTTLVTITVESPYGQRNGPLELPEWHLPTFDPKNENKYMYKLHTLEIYFWAKEDAVVFINAAHRVLPQQQVTVLDEPIAPLPHVEPMSPVVQKLENVAITDPSYQQGQTKNSQNSAPSFPGPPSGLPPSSTPQHQEPQAFVPMAYNPAAPAAPEIIQHREKTPPPDDGTGNPLVAAAAADQGQYGFSGPPQPQGSYFPMGGLPPPPASQPPPSQSPYAHHFQNSFAGPPSAMSPVSPPVQPSPTPATLPPYQQHQGSQQQASYASSSHGVPSPAYSQAVSEQTPGPSAAPPGGFAQYNYGGPSSSDTKPMNNNHSIHSLVYRPTELENSTKHHEKPIPQTGLPPPSGKLEMRANQVEKKLGGLFKKLEKKYG